MKNATWIFWTGLVAIVVISVSIAFFAPISEFFKGLATIPAIGALSFTAFQLFRDHLSHLRTAELQSEQQLFNLGATSHMANVVFDKHVEFCEKYLTAVHQAIQNLIKNGPNLNAAFDADILTNLRIEYTAWITPDINDKLRMFEQAVKKIGANTLHITMLDERADNEDERSQAIKEMYDLINGILEKQSSEKNFKANELNAEALKDYIRKILQVDQLVLIREYLVEKAASAATGR